MADPTTRMTVSDIAELAGVQRSTVSNWQRRHDDFPKALSDSPAGRPQFDAAAVQSWLAARNNETLVREDRAAEVVRTWRYMVNHAQYDDGTDPLILLIAAIEGERVSYSEDGGYDERYPVSISADDYDTRIYTTKSQAEAIQEFLKNELGGADRTRLVEAAAQEFDELGRWRRSPDAVTAEQNLRNLLAGLVHEESGTVLDFACGTGALLVAASRVRPRAKLYGMEPDFIESFIADARTIAEIEEVDILEVDALAGRTFDAVISIPPFGRKVDGTASERLRRLPFGPVRGTADSAWPQIAVQALAPDGEAFLVLPHGLTSDDRADHVRRELIQQGVLSAVVSLPANAHRASKGMSDLWVLSRRREASSDILFVNYSTVDPTDDHEYAHLTHELCNWLDDPKRVDSGSGDDARFIAIAPIKLLGQTVNLDPLYWSARAATATSGVELIDAANAAIAGLDQARTNLTQADVPKLALKMDQPVMVTVRDARDEGLLDVLRRPVSPKNRQTTADGLPETQTLRLSDAEAMRQGHQAGMAVQYGKEQPDPQMVRQGDVLVWATADRQVHTAVCTVTGLYPASAITVLRCSEEVDPQYLALALAAGRNAIYVTGSTLPSVRGLDLSFPLVPLGQQRAIAGCLQAAQRLGMAARDVAATTETYQQALADAVGSGSVGVADEDVSR